MIKYKPWNDSTDSLWEGLEATNETYCQKWKEFINSPLGRELVPNWKRHYINANNFEYQVEDEENEPLRTWIVFGLYISNIFQSKFKCTSKDNPFTFHKLQKQFMNCFWIVSFGLYLNYEFSRKYLAIQMRFKNPFQKQSMKCFWTI